MKVLVVGGGGREHVIAWKIKQSSKLSKLYCCPGNAGTAAIAHNVSPDGGVQGLATWAKQEGIDLTVVGPEAPLAEGLVDEFEKQGLKVFGPSKAAAKLESSKSFAKEVMLNAGVNTARGAVFRDFETAKAYIEEQGAPIVVKADGLAAGKGVVVASSTQEALEALEHNMLDGVFGEAGKTVVVEECLEGKEASIMALVDGEDVCSLAISSDHKRLNDGGKGPNTGGMGAISPTSVLSEDFLDEARETIFLPTIRELKKQGIYFRGFLYAGVMVSSSGAVNVLEFNCRLGDPEAQVLLFRLKK